MFVCIENIGNGLPTVDQFVSSRTKGVLCVMAVIDSEGDQWMIAEVEYNQGNEGIPCKVTTLKRSEYILYNIDSDY